MNRVYLEEPEWRLSELPPVLEEDCECESPWVLWEEYGGEG